MKTYMKDRSLVIKESEELTEIEEGYEDSIIFVNPDDICAIEVNDKRRFADVLNSDTLQQKSSSGQQSPNNQSLSTSSKSKKTGNDYENNKKISSRKYAYYPKGTLFKKQGKTVFVGNRAEMNERIEFIVESPGEQTGKEIFRFLGSKRELPAKLIQEIKDNVAERVNKLDY